MNNLAPFITSGSSNTKMKELSNWDKPGGKLGIVVAGLLGAGVLVGLYKILPFLISLATNLLTLGLLLVLIALLLWVVTNKDFRRLCSVGYFMLMRKITGIFVEIDPISIVKRRVGMLKKKMGEIQTLLGKLKGSINDLERKNKERTSELETTIQEVKIYNEQGASKKMQAQIATNKVTRLKELLDTYQGDLKQSKKWYEILTKLYEMAQLTVEDTENEVEIRTEQFTQMKKQHSIFKSVMSIVKGNPDEVALFNNAMDFMAQDISNKLGEMEFVIDSAGGLMDQYEMGKTLSSKKADEIISKYDMYGIEGVLSSFTEPKAIENSSVPVSILALDETKEPEPVKIDTSSKHEESKSRLFN